MSLNARYHHTDEREPATRIRDGLMVLSKVASGDGRVRADVLNDRDLLDALNAFFLAVTGTHLEPKLRELRDRIHTVLNARWRNRGVPAAVHTCGYIYAPGSLGHCPSCKTLLSVGITREITLA